MEINKLYTNIEREQYLKCNPYKKTEIKDTSSLVSKVTDKQLFS